MFVFILIVSIIIWNQVLSIVRFNLLSVPLLVKRLNELFFWRLYFLNFSFVFQLTLFGLFLSFRSFLFWFFLFRVKFCLYELFDLFLIWYLSIFWWFFLELLMFLLKRVVLIGKLYFRWVIERSRFNLMDLFGFKISALFIFIIGKVAMHFLCRIRGIIILNLLFFNLFLSLLQILLRLLHVLSKSSYKLFINLKINWL